MEKIFLKCKNNNCEIKPKLGVFFHAWIMDQLSNSVASNLHENCLHPFATYVTYNDDYVKFCISLLNEKKCQPIKEAILNDKLKSINVNNGLFNIISKDTCKCTEEQLSHIFYEEDASRYITLNFVTPTAFKTGGEYFFYPDLKLLFHSLLMKYNFIFENNQHVDNDLLEQICNTTSIVYYNLRSYRYPVHNVSIPSFIGKITLHCRGSQTLVNYLNMLFHFGEYSGVGVKTAMGMGHIKIFNKESSNNAKK